MPTSTCVPTTWRGRPAHLVIGDELETVVTATGCHLACLRRRGEALNPLWQPRWPAAEPAAAASGAYGEGPEAAILTTIVGSNLCMDRFAVPWPGERKPLHGEGGVTRWRRIASADSIAFAADLPQAALTVERSLRLAGATLELATTIRHRGGAPRAVEWCEHTTLGDPFLDGAEFAADVDRVTNWPGEIGADSRFLAQAGEAGLDPRAVLRMPRVGEQPCGDCVSARVAAGSGSAWWTATNRRLGRRLRVEWERADFPWLALWTQHRSRTTPPWNGRERTRGMEIATKPFPEGKPPASRFPRYQGRSTECLVPAGAKGRTHVVRFTWERC